MRKTIAMLVLVALACGLTACGLGGRGETFEPAFDGAMVPVRRLGVVTSSQVNFQGFLDLLERMQGREYRPLAQSRVVSRQQTYMNHWQRVVYFSYPRFTDEISEAAAQRIDNYYRQRYRACTARDDFPWLTGMSEIADSVEAMIQYRLQVYAVELLEDYVAVRFHRDSHLGGGVIETEVAADVFDRHTGEKRALRDFVQTDEQMQTLNRAVAEHLRMADIRPHEPFDVQQAQSQAFTVAENALVLLFSPGELAPATRGVIEVEIPWTALEQ